MFDLEKFKTGDYYVHLPTYELYNKVIEWLDDEGFVWNRGKNLYEYDAWNRLKEETCISYEGDGFLSLGYLNVYKSVDKKLEINTESTKLKVGDKVRVKSYRIDTDVMKQGDIGYVAHQEPQDFDTYYVVQDKKLVGKDIFDIPYQSYDIFQDYELEKLHSHAEVNAQLGLVRTLSMGPRSNKERYTELMLENKEIYLDKNKKYGDAFAETIQKYGYISALTRMNDKFNRIEEFTLKGFKDEEESLRDSLMDLANYCYMYVMEIEKENEDE